MIYESTLYSIIFQVITSLVDVYGLSLKVDDKYNILKQLLSVELGVQVIELIFYIWLFNSISTHKNITKFRYLDWFFTTPVMLITLMAYLTIEPGRTSDLWDFLKNDNKSILIVLFLNMLMLLFGYVAEINPTYNLLLVILGFIPFAIYYYKIYKEYLIPHQSKEEVHPFFTRSRLFWYFVIVWALYGVAALMPYIMKNTAYNILDVFAKNTFGLMLVAIIYHNST
jgi:bacteriorhodopsin